MRAVARKRYNTTKIKAINVLANIAYRRYKKSDFNNGNFAIDVCSFLLQNVNPLMIDRKFDNENDRQCVKMLLQKSLPQQFTQYIFLCDNFLALLTEHPSDLNQIKVCLAENAKVIQYLYATFIQNIIPVTINLLYKTNLW